MTSETGTYVDLSVDDVKHGTLDIPELVYIEQQSGITIMRALNLHRKALFQYAQKPTGFALLGFAFVGTRVCQA